MKIETHVRASVLLGVLAIFFALLRSTVEAACSVALGLTLAIANLLTIAWFVRGFARKGDDGATGAGGLRSLIVLKPLALLGVTFLLLRIPYVVGAAFAIGIAVLPLGIVVGEVQERLSMRP